MQHKLEKYVLKTEIYSIEATLKQRVMVVENQILTKISSSSADTMIQEVQQRCMVAVTQVRERLTTNEATLTRVKDEMVSLTERVAVFESREPAPASASLHSQLSDLESKLRRQISEASRTHQQLVDSVQMALDSHIREGGSDAQNLQETVTQFSTRVERSTRNHQQQIEGLTSRVTALSTQVSTGSHSVERLEAQGDDRDRQLRKL